MRSVDAAVGATDLCDLPGRVVRCTAISPRSTARMNPATPARQKRSLRYDPSFTQRHLHALCIPPSFMTITNVQDDDSEPRLRVKATGPPKSSSGTDNAGQCSEQSAQDSLSEASSQEEDTEYQVQDNVRPILSSHYALVLALLPVCPGYLQHMLVLVVTTTCVPVALLGSVHKCQAWTALQNDECCSSCGSKKDSDKLLCCELCPRVYHLYCLKPPLKAIPSGDWFCIHCQKILCLEHVEKFLAFRTRLVVCSSVDDIDQ